MRLLHLLSVRILQSVPIDLFVLILVVLVMMWHHVLKLLDFQIGGIMGVMLVVELVVAVVQRQHLLVALVKAALVHVKGSKYCCAILFNLPQIRLL